MYRFLRKLYEGCPKSKFPYFRKPLKKYTENVKKLVFIR